MQIDPLHFWTAMVFLGSFVAYVIVFILNLIGFPDEEDDEI